MDALQQRRRYQRAYRLGQTVVLFGDSITFNCGPATVSTSSFTYAKGYFTWANILLRQSFDLLVNLGVGGDDTIEMLARISQATLYRPAYYMVLAGSNDINTIVTTAADIEARLVQIYETFWRTGAKVIASTITPSEDYDADRIAMQQAVNAWLVPYAAANSRRMILADMAALVTDPATGLPWAGWTDGTHPYPPAAYQMGVAMAAVIQPRIVIPETMASVATDPRVINANPLMAGDTAGVATSYTLGQGTGATVEASKVARDDGFPGTWQQLVQSVAGTANSTLSSALVSAGFAPGGTIFAQVDFKIADITSLKLFYVKLTCQNAAYSNIKISYSAYQTDGEADIGATVGFAGVLRTPEIIIPADTVYIRAQVYFRGVATFSVGRCEIRKV